MKENHRAPSGAWRRSAAAAIALGAAVLATGCTGTIRTRGFLVAGYPAVRAELVPAAITAYPRVFYNGTYAYLVDGVWYYPTTSGWVVFEQEPIELRRYREGTQPSPRFVPQEPEYSYPRERGRRHYTPR